ncbi:VOC family protein [uncultured Williamsia sp.]|uniref:VOC family protein n=1 Tax=uncultured Williamsia sp. TaxID=259311 RepID=UPI0026113363|nr:VOC family protein [uncultured Williamsia sp.]
MPEYSAPVGAPIWFDLMSSDPARAAEFYGALFGWDVEAPRAEFGGYQNFTRAGSRIAGMSPVMDGAGVPSDVWSVYLHTTDAAATAAAAEKAGAQVLFPPMAVGTEGTMLLVSDPAGAAIGFWQPDQHPGYTTWGEHGAPYWFECQSKDYDASVAFYSSVAGASPLEVGSGGDESVQAPERYTQLMFGEMGYAGIMDATKVFPPEVPSFWQFYITVDDVAAATAKVSDLGGEVMMGGEDTPFGTLAAAKDPMGAIFCYASPPPGM